MDSSKYTRTFDRPSNASMVNPATLPEPPKGHVWVEWVGEASPMDSPIVRFNLIANKYTREQRRVIKELSRVRIARTHRHTRTLRRGNGAGQLTSLHVPYVRFGPNQRAAPGTTGSFTQSVPFKTADAIKSSASGHEFIIHNERDGEHQNMIQIQETGLKADAHEAFKNFSSFRKEMGW